MKQEDSKDVSAGGDATSSADAAMQEGIKVIAAEVDFKPYLDAVSDGSQRTRFLVYVLIAALLLMLTAYRDTAFPDWVDARITRLQLASVCLRDNDVGPQCVERVNYAKSFIFQGDTSPTASFDDEFRDEMETHIKELIRRRAEALTLHLPFFGLAIDMNDVGIIGGLLLASILYVLYASLSSETDSLERARKKAQTIKDDAVSADYLELLLMSQVLASPSKGKLGIGKGLYVFFGLVALIHLWFCIDDTKSYPTGVLLEGRSYANVDMFFEWTFCALVLLFSGLCIYQQRELNRSVHSLAHLIGADVEGKSGQEETGRRAG